MAAMALAQCFAPLVQRAQERRKVLLRQQVAQPLGIRRRDIERQVMNVGVEHLHATLVVLGRALVRRIAVLADVDADDGLAGRLPEVLHEYVYTGAIQAKAIDDGACARDAEKPWRRIARLRA